MIEIVTPLKTLISVDKICIDNTVFRFHYLLTRFVLLACSGFVAAKQYIGEPMDCFTPSKLDPKTVNAYCWIHTTYTGLPGTNIFKVEAHPGVHPTFEDEDEKHQKYYQWVVFVLLMQSLLFNIPHHLWKDLFEGERMKDLVTDLTQPIGDPEKKTKRRKLLLDYLVGSFGLENHQIYVYKFLACELLNLVNVVGQILLTDRFLDYEFTIYGTKVLNFLTQDPEKRTDAMNRLFPKVAKCTFKVYGPSGQIVPHDALCVLPINNMNEKIYVFLWGWFVLLAFITSLAVIFRVATMCCRPMRSYLLFWKSKACNFKECDFITSQLSFSNWFLLCQIGNNVESSLFAELVSDIHDKLMSVNEIKDKEVDQKV